MGAPQSELRPAALDLVEMRRRLADDEGLIADVVAAFLDDYPARLDEVHRGLASQDARAIRAAAHAVKGAASNLAGVPAADAAARLERCCDGAAWADAREAVHLLEFELVRLADALLAVAPGARA
jgi:HPt (histidine-containing phosphotransfer) domain-containing protein